MVAPRDEMARLNGEGDARIVLREGPTFELRRSAEDCERAELEAGVDGGADAEAEAEADAGR